MKKTKSNRNKMKQIVLTSFMSLGMVFGSASMNSSMANVAMTSAKPGSKTKSSSSRSVTSERTSSKKAAIAKDRADHLSDQMITKLKLNNYQSNKIRQINLDKISKMMDIEEQYGSDPQMVESKCKGVCDQRDVELEDLLSTDQYTKYFGARRYFNKLDQVYAQNGGSTKTVDAIASNSGGSGNETASGNQTLSNE
jgi:hypothetical protein